jgi:succinate dehydrogenase / fumarate reductase cytochrome b subunit
MTMSDSSMTRPPRPLSPHLQIYRPQITSVLSILHRITGILLFAGTLVIALWLWAAAYDAPMLSCLRDGFAHWLGRAAMIGWSAAFFYHLFNGVRHLAWDTGRGFALATVTLSGMATLGLTVLCTAALWWQLLGGGA